MEQNRKPRRGVSRRRVLQGATATVALFGLTGQGCQQGIPDVNIGGVNIGGLTRSAVDLFEGMTLGEEDELRIGEAMYPQLVAEGGGAYPNSRVQSAMKSFTAPLFRASTRSAMKWEVTVLDDDIVNAWALPGGKLAVNKGLLRYVANEHELAAVLSHEIGHIEKAHAINELRTKKATGAITSAGREVIRSQAGAAGAITDQFIGAIAPALTNLVTSGYSRDAEFEADQFIFASFDKTGYDPKQAPGFFRTLLQLIPESETGTTSLFSSHPDTRARVAKLQETSAALSAAGAKSGDRDFAALRETFPLRRYFRRNAAGA
jgi:predicted Zn-dependent protease